YRDYSAVNSDAKNGFPAFGVLGKSGAALLFGFNSTLPFPEVEIDFAFFTQALKGVAPASCQGSQAKAPLAGQLVWEFWNGVAWPPWAGVEAPPWPRSQDAPTPSKPPPAGTLTRAVVGIKTDVPRYWIRARLQESRYQLPPRLLAVRTNTASATQAQTIS